MNGRFSTDFAPLRVLVVDTDANARDALEKQLRHAGFLDVATSPTTANALYLLGKIDFDLAFVAHDDEKSEMAALLASARPIGAQVIALLSPSTDVSRQAMPARLPVLTKPIDPGALMLVISSTLAQRPLKAAQPAQEPFSGFSEPAAQAR